MPLPRCTGGPVNMGLLVLLAVFHWLLVIFVQFEANLCNMANCSLVVASSSFLCISAILGLGT